MSNFSRVAMINAIRKDFEFMENNNQNTAIQEGATTTVEAGAAGQTEKLFTEAEVNAKIQSEGDKIRTKYANRVKELEDEVKKLTPVQKSEAEIDFENRLASLEAREKKLNFLENLKAKGVSHELSDYIREDADLDKLSATLTKIVNDTVTERVRQTGYKPTDHKSGETVTAEAFAKMSLDEKERLFAENPEIYRSLVGR